MDGWGHTSCERTPHLDHEKGLWREGYRYIAGIDEAGRGAWAGPVVAAAVILPPEPTHLAQVLAPVRDSKLLRPVERAVCYELILTHAIAWGIGSVSAQEIDHLGIVPATQKAMCLALENLTLCPDFLLIDALLLDQVNLPQRALVHGDRLSLSIAAASILAKVTRDRWMVALDAIAPGYGLAQHKGYGTQQHREALERLGPTPFHRRSYAPIASLGDLLMPHDQS